MNFRLQGNNVKNTTKRVLLSRVMLVTGITTMMFLLLVSASPYSSILSLQQQQAEAAASLPLSFRLGHSILPPAYIVVDGKASRLQLENGDPSSGDATADYSIPAQGTISFGERFQLLVPQFPRIFKDVQSAELTICGDESCATDDFHVRHELVNVRDTRFVYVETHLIDAPGGVGDGFTASEVGFKIPLLWTVSFTDGTEQTYLAIVHLQGDPCEEHGWVYSRGGTTCVDPNA
jgi:hypothetical protein